MSEPNNSVINDSYNEKTNDFYNKRGLYCN